MAMWVACDPIGRKGSAGVDQAWIDHCGPVGIASARRTACVENVDEGCVSERVHG
jgi:hypothetical protein